MRCVARRIMLRSTATTACAASHCCSRSSPRARNFGVAVAQADSAIENWPLRRGVRIVTEIALAFELHGLAGILHQNRLDAGILENFEGLRIELRSQILRRRIRL